MSWNTSVTTPPSQPDLNGPEAPQACLKIRAFESVFPRVTNIWLSTAARYRRQPALRPNSDWSRCLRVVVRALTSLLNGWVNSPLTKERVDQDGPRVTTMQEIPEVQCLNNLKVLRRLRLNLSR
jgi:hypothetical protein